MTGITVQRDDMRGSGNRESARILAGWAFFLRGSAVLI